MITRFTHTVLRTLRHRTQQGFADSVVRFAVGGSGFVMPSPDCSASGYSASVCSMSEAQMSGAELSGTELPEAAIPGAPIQDHSSGMALGAALNASQGAIAARIGAVLSKFLGGSSLIRFGGDFGGNADHLGRFISLKPIMGTVFGRPELCLSTPIQQWLNLDYVQPKSGRFRTSPTSP